MIYLCSIPFLDNSYTNVIDFESLSSQNAYFDTQSTKRIMGNIITDGEREQFTLNLTFQELKAYDYLYMIDPVTLKRYYYFITNKSYKTSTSSIVDVELDVYSTYLFDHQLLHSFVDRCHVPRWNGSIPSNEIVDEGLPIHDYIITGKEKIAEKKPSYVMTSTDPLGILTQEELDNITDADSSPPPAVDGGINPGVGNITDDKKVTNEAGTFLIPANGTITATYPKYPLSYVGQSHASCSPNCADCKHTGIDIANATGTNIYAAQYGKVVEVVHSYQDGVGYGKKVVIDHGNGVSTLYAHLNTINVEVGYTVAAGSVIATMGSTGNSTGPHLHWEVRKNGVGIQPDGNNKMPINSVIKIH